MINTISNWASGIIAALIVTTLIEMLLPNNKTKKYIKMVIGIYIIFCIISPLIDENIIDEIEKEISSFAISKQSEDLATGQFSNSWNISQSLQTENSNSVSSIEQLYIEEFKKEIISKVESLGYEVIKCDVDIQIDATKDNAGINKIYLQVKDNEEAQNKIEENKDENIEIENIEVENISINDTQIGENIENDEETEDTKIIKNFLCNYYEITTDKIKIVQN